MFILQQYQLSDPEIRERATLQLFTAAALVESQVKSAAAL